MAKLDISSETEELAWELTQKHPDTYRIKWLLEDGFADLQDALKKAHLQEKDLLKNPILRPLQLQKRLYER